MLLDLPPVEGVCFREHPRHAGYFIGDDGSVWSRFLAGGKPGRTADWHPLSLYRRPYGARYFVVCLRTNRGKGKVICCYVHRLVLEAFIGPCPEGWEGCHGDGDTANNSLSNLRWATKSDNATDKIQHGKVRSKMTPDQVREIRRLAANGMKHREIAKMFGISSGQTGLIVRRRCWLTIYRTPWPT